MSFDILAVRARGLGSRVLPEVIGAPRVIEDLVRERAAQELAILHRWGGEVVTAFELDEDRRSLRAIARGIAANVGSAQRVIGAVPTSSLPQRLLGRLANATSFSEVRVLLDDHPFADAFDHADLFEIELALARRYFASVHVRDTAFAIYRAQLADIENAQAALLLATRGGDLEHETVFLTGGERLDRATFLAAAADPDGARARLAHAFAGTPLAGAIFASRPSAIEDAALAWQLATQTQLRRREPLGLAPVLWLVLHRREDSRRLRRAAWSAALGGVG